MVLSIGHHLCGECHHRPRFLLTPCEHQVCVGHALEVPTDGSTLEAVCGVCGSRVHAISDSHAQFPLLNAGPRIHNPVTFFTPRFYIPVSTMSAPGASRSTGSSAGNRGDSQSGRSMPSLRNMTPTQLRDMNNTTPTPLRTTAVANYTEEFTMPRYVPPPMRDESERTQSSASSSSSSITSQLEMARLPSQMPAARPRQTNTVMTPPSQQAASLTFQFGSMDPFAVTPRGAQASRTSSSVDAGTNAFLANLPRTENLTGLHSFSPDPVYNASFASINSVVTPSVQSSGNDSGSFNAYGFEASYAARLANLIKSGATEDPHDIDYGNPGRSRRLPPEPVNQVPTAPRPEGKLGSPHSPAINTASSGPQSQAAAFLGTASVQLPNWFRRLPAGQLPTVEQVMNVLPMVEACRLSTPTDAAVVAKITNIPYSASRSEIMAFLGRNAQILSQPEGSPYHAVHIMLDRYTGKTMDAFVELRNRKEGDYAMKQYEARTRNGRRAKIGDREVEVTIVGEGEFMAELFNRAGDTVTWFGPTPNVSSAREEYYEGVPSAGFQGFLKPEELVYMSKYAETPQRSPFAQRCPIRNYEHLITILHKYPWHAIEHVQMNERDRIYNTTLTSIRALMGLLRKTHNNTQLDNTRPTMSTLQELVVAALTCPGFSEAQKYIVVANLHQSGNGSVANSRGMNFRFGGTHKFASDWPFEGLAMQPGVDETVVEYIAALIHAATVHAPAPTLAELHTYRAAAMQQSLFGMLDIDYTGAKTMADVGRIELRTIKSLLSRVLPRAGDDEAQAEVHSTSSSSAYGSPDYGRASRYR